MNLLPTRVNETKAKVILSLLNENPSREEKGDVEENKEKNEVGSDRA